VWFGFGFGFGFGIDLDLILVWVLVSDLVFGFDILFGVGFILTS
jgi:hypothetical protein